MEVKKNIFSKYLVSITSLVVLSFILGMPGICRAAERGLYAIWYAGKENPDEYLNQPYISGGQIVLQWADIEVRKGQYDFSELERQLASMDERKMLATVQINGNVKPRWLFDGVPYLREKLSVQIRDDLGSLMYWHPEHRESYVSMLRALGRYLNTSRYRESVLGIRMNLNALGTEHHNVPKEFVPLELWVIPEGVQKERLAEWSREIDRNYTKAVIDTFIETFKGSVRILVRNGIEEDLLAAYKEDFEKGTLSWFHTSSEVEPRAGNAERKYKRFYDYCRSGKTIAYAEPWASAWGHHGPKRDDRWCSPPQWNYWRLLFDLHCGVSHIALYSSDMQMAIEGVYEARDFRYRDVGGAFQKEFEAAFRFAAKYAGFHASPRSSPGAWVALRENHVVRAENDIPEDQRRLNFFTSDYNFLMERIPGDKTQGLDVVNIGPDDQRFGAFARILPAGETMSFSLNPVFVRSLESNTVEVRVTYLDDSRGSFDVRVGEEDHLAAKMGSGNWETASIRVSTQSLARQSNDADIRILARDSEVYFHMVEVLR